MSAIRVMLTGDCPLLRSGFRQVLESAGMAVVGSADTAADAIDLLKRAAADVVLLGAVTRHTASDAQEICSAYPSLPVLVLGRVGDAEAIRAALTGGARG